MEPLEVWKVELAAGLAHRDVRGTLHLGTDALEFSGKDATPPMRIGYASIARVKRLRVSSVLLIHWREGAATRHTAFYLTKPPPLDPTGAEVTSARAARSPFTRKTRRGQQRRNSYYLASTGTELKPTLVTWVAEVRLRTRDAGT